jgi:riboflavin biosynthesis pyrimidine reductase
MSWVRANLVVGADGSTAINGSSKGLSSGHDRARFHAIRAEATAIVIGGATSRNEPYGSTPVPLFVVTHENILPGSAATNENATLLNLSPAKAIAQIKAEGFGRILVEGGAHFLTSLTHARAIDGIYLTRTTAVPNEAIVDFHELLAGFVLASSEAAGAETFEYYERG